MKNRAEVLEVYKDEPLIFYESSEEGLSPDGVVGSSIYYGTGLTTAKAMSIGLPFDVLGMVLLAEKLRRSLGMRRIFQLVADTHALSNDFIDPVALAGLTEKVEDTMERVKQALGMQETFQVLKASEMMHDSRYQEIYSSISTDDHEYVRREWADIAYLRKVNDLGLKLSWMVDPKAKKVGFDERLFDLRFTEVIGEPMSFVYTASGRTLTQNRSRVSPYISIPDEKRIMLDSAEKPAEKLEEAKNELTPGMFTTVEEHLSAILSLYDELVAPLNPEQPISERIEQVLKRIFA